MDQTIEISDFEAKCFELVDEVAATGRPIVLTRHGRALVRVVPVEQPKSLKGSVTILVSEEEFLKPLDEDWDAER
jgi:prevent-host-death family protein